MADKWPLANGNWSNAANWNDGTKPVSGDDVYADGKTVTIDEDVNIGSGTLRNSQRSGGTGGGSFSVSTNRTITANLVAGTGSSCLSVGGSANLAFNGNVTGGTANSIHGIVHSGSTVTITGNVTGGGGPSAFGVDNTGAGTLTVIGNVTAGAGGVGIRNLSTGTVNITGTLTAAAQICVTNNSTGTVNIAGDVNAGSGLTAYGVYNAGAGTVNITGNVAAGSGSSAIGVRNDAAGIVNITGNATGGSNTTAHGVYNGGAGTITVTGNVTGSSGSSAMGAVNASTGSLTITGNATAGSGSTAYGAQNASTGLLRVYGAAVGNDHGLGYVTNNGNPGVVGYGINTGVIQATTTVRSIRYGAKGQSPTAGLVQLDTGSLANSTAKFRTAPTSFTEYTFGPPENIGGQPAASNVRLGTVYNFGNTTGTCAVPPASSVAYGVPVDNTTGTAVLTEAGLSALFEAALQPNAQLIVERSTNDNKAITFSWPVSGATITGQKSIDNGAYTAVVGAITFLRTESNRHYYALAYNAADRNTVESSIRYKMTDGTYTKYFNLHVVPSGDVDVVVTPLQAVVDQMIRGTRIEVPLGYTGTVGPVVVTDTSNNPIDISAPSELIISKKWRGDILVIPDGSINRSGAGNNQFTISASGATLIPGEHAWALRRLSDKFVFAKGDWVVKQTATKD